MYITYCKRKYTLIGFFENDIWRGLAAKFLRGRGKCGDKQTLNPSIPPFITLRHLAMDRHAKMRKGFPFQIRDVASKSPFSKDARCNLAVHGCT